MKNIKIIFIAILFIGLLAISNVSASEDISDDVALIEPTDEINIGQSFDDEIETMGISQESEEINNKEINDEQLVDESSDENSDVLMEVENTRLSCSRKIYKFDDSPKLFSATLKDSSGKALRYKKISFTINGAVYVATTDEMGKASINIPDEILDIGDYEYVEYLSYDDGEGSEIIDDQYNYPHYQKRFVVTVSFEGDSLYNASRIKNQVIIIKDLDDVKLHFEYAYNVFRYNATNKTVSVTLKDSNNNVIEGKRISVFTMSADEEITNISSGMTNEEGVASIVIPDDKLLLDGKYRFVDSIEYFGDGGDSDRIMYGEDILEEYNHPLYQRKQTFLVSFDGDEDFSALRASVIIVIIKEINEYEEYLNNKYQISVEPSTIEVGEEVNINIKAPVSEEKVKIYVDDTAYKITFLYEGKVNESINDLSAGQHSIKIVIYDYDEDDYTLSKIFNITVKKTHTEITPNEEIIHLFIGDESKINYILNPENSIGDITFSSSNPSLVSVDSNGKIKALGEGSAIITISFSGSENFEASTASVNIFITKKATQITATDVTTTYHVNKDLIITLKDDDGKPLSGVNVSVDLNGMKNYLTDSNGQIKLSTGDLKPNSYDVAIVFDGNESYVGSTATAKIIINKISTELFAPEVTTTYNINKDLIITLKDCFSNPMSNEKIIVSINDDIKNCTTDSEGMVKISSKNLSADIYNVFITFFGNEIYNGLVITTKIIINKDSTQLSSSKVVATYNVNNYLVVNLKDANGHILANKTVTVKVGSISKTLITNAKGQVSVLVSSLVPKTYTATISFAGDSYYGKSSTTAIVVVKKATPKLTAKAKTFRRSVKTKKYTITLKNNKGVVMKNTKVTLTVNKKTYSAKTNSKGVATFKITSLKKKGKFTAVVKYAGSKYYNKVTKKPKITIKA